MQSYLQVILSWSSEIDMLIQLHDPFKESTQTLEQCSTSNFAIFATASSTTPYLNIHIELVHFASGDMSSLFSA